MEGFYPFTLFFYDGIRVEMAIVAKVLSFFYVVIKWEVSECCRVLDGHMRLHSTPPPFTNTDGSAKSKDSGRTPAKPKTMLIDHQKFEAR